MPPTFRKITIDKNGGDISISVRCPKYPQSISGQTEEYKLITDPAPVNTYDFSTAKPVSILGKPSAIDQHLFVVNGSVLNQGDDPPTPYQIEILLLQDGKTLDTHLDPDPGPGKTSDQDIPFIYRLQLIAA